MVSNLFLPLCMHTSRIRTTLRTAGRVEHECVKNASCVKHLNGAHETSSETLTKL